MILAWFIFGLGTVISLLNFYLSFIRCPLLSRLGNTKVWERNVSGLPLLGSLLVAISLIWLHPIPYLTVIAVAIILSDTGGIHWFITSILLRRGNKKDKDKPTT